MVLLKKVIREGCVTLANGQRDGKPPVPFSGSQPSGSSKLFSLLF